MISFRKSPKSVGYSEHDWVSNKITVFLVCPIFDTEYPVVLVFSTNLEKRIGFPSFRLLLQQRVCPLCTKDMLASFYLVTTKTPADY